jgi:Double zinc ribbon/Domain of unknown function (DUF4878)
MRQCPNCGKEVSPNAKFCNNCAFDMSKVPQNPAYAETQVVKSSACPNCGASVAPGVKFCPNCAAPIAAGAAVPGGQNYPGGGGYPGPQNYPGGAGYPQQGAGYPAAGYPGAGYGGPAYATAQKSKMPLIIGAVVLLLLIGGGVAAYFLWFNKSDGNSNTSGSTTTNSNRAGGTATSTTPSESPGDVAKKILRGLERGDASTVRPLLAKSMQGSVDGLVQEASKDIQSHGGIDTVTISEESVTGNSASLRFTLKYKDGEDHTEKMGFVKEDGAWKMNDL